MAAIGDSIRVRVSEIREFGFFADGQGVRALVLLPEMGGPWRHPSERVSLGQEVMVRLEHFSAEQDTFRASLHPA